jgi:hypothetical protein
MWAFEKCERCPQELDLAVREGSALRALPEFGNLSRLDAGDLKFEKALPPWNERARLSVEFAR